MRHFLKTIRFTVLPILLFIYIITGYYWITIRPLETGDIGRLGKIEFGDYSNTNMKYLDSLTCFWSTDLNIPTKKFDIVIFGDSYANHETQRLNGFSNILSINYGYSIFSFEGNTSPEQRVISAIQNNLIKRYEPKIILLESVGREFVYRLANLDFNDKQNYIDSLIIKRNINKQQNYLIEAKNWVLLKSKLKQNPIKKYPLNKAYFSSKHKYASNLFVYHESIIPRFDTILFQKAIANLIKLDSLCKRKNYKLLYTVAPDNYDVYHKHILGDKEAANKYLEWIEENEDLSQIYINIKQPLFDAADEGKMDIYYLNDTHWSSVGAKIVAYTIDQFIHHMHNTSKNNI